jgi:hypothetical protein
MSEAHAAETRISGSSSASGSRAIMVHVSIRRLLAWPLLLAAMPAAAAPQHYHCRQGEEVRRIEIELAGPDGGPPCGVLYRPEAAQSQASTVAWRNLASLDQCQSKADELAKRLTAKGWTCAREPVRPTRPAAPAASAPAVAASARDGRLAAERALAALQASERIARALQQAEQRAQDQDAAWAEGRVRPAALEIARAPLTRPAPPPLATRPVLAPPPALAAVVAAHLGRLERTIEGRLHAEVAELGDLDADRDADAVVLYTQESETAPYRQFLTVYLAEGERYQLIATRSIGGSYRGARDAAVDGIARGVIDVSLRTFEPGDAACCPSGRRAQAFRLDALQLVEVDRPAP